MILEKCPEDVYKMNKNQYKMLFIPQEADEYIVDYFIDGESTMLAELEKRVYERIKSKEN